MEYAFAAFKRAAAHGRDNRLGARINGRWCALFVRTAIVLRALPAGAVIAGRRKIIAEAALVRKTADGMVAFGHFDMVLRQFINKARRQSRVPLAVRAAIAGKADGGALFGAGNADIGEAALFLQAFGAAFIKAALMGKQAFFPPGQKHAFKFQPFGGVQRHDGDFVFIVVIGRFHDQRNMFEIAGQRLKFFH